MASVHMSTCAKSLVNNLDDLRKRSESESLRPYLTSEGCFPSYKDPSTAAITIEELKKLARAWKLNGILEIFSSVYSISVKL